MTSGAAAKTEATTKGRRLDSDSRTTSLTLSACPERLRSSNSSSSSSSLGTEGRRRGQRLGRRLVPSLPWRTEADIRQLPPLPAGGGEEPP